jgi:hypothetical protein
VTRIINAHARFKCVGVRFVVGTLVQLVYASAAQAGIDSMEKWHALDNTKFSLDKQGIELLRGSLGYPLNFAQPTVRCVVSGVHGLDAGSCNERFVVASRLWSEGMYVRSSSRTSYCSMNKANVDASSPS